MLTPILEVNLGFFHCRPVEELPNRVAEPEKGLAVLPYQEAAVIGNVKAFH
jgi:hypothetical protein